MSLLLESMTPLAIGELTIRIWREETLPLLDRLAFELSDIAEAANKLKNCTNPMTIARTLILLPRVNAVEVLDEERYGIVLYRDWP